MGLARVVGSIFTGSFAYTTYLWYFHDLDSSAANFHYVKVVGPKAKSIPQGSLSDDGALSKLRFDPKDSDTLDNGTKRANVSKVDVSKANVSESSVSSR